LLALLIVGSVALMPSEADSKPRAQAAVKAAKAEPSPKATPEPPHDFTYN
jgi:hypothetical protein